MNVSTVSHILGFWQNAGGSQGIIDERYNGVPPIGILPDSRRESMYRR